jgi:hypothetical protein
VLRERSVSDGQHTPANGNQVSAGEAVVDLAVRPSCVPKLRSRGDPVLAGSDCGDLCRGVIGGHRSTFPQRGSRLGNPREYGGSAV